MTPKKNVGYRYPRYRLNAKKYCDQNGLRQGFKNPDFHRLRPRHKCLRISDLVYKFLGNIATINAERRQRNNARTNFQRAHVRKSNRQRRRPDNPISTDGILLQSRYQIPKKYLESNFHKMPLPHRMKLSGKKSSVQVVKDYIKAVNKSKRRAERYICKALSFGVDTGLLMPSHSKGHVFRVSSILDVKMLNKNMILRNEKEENDSWNQERCSYHRSKGPNLKIVESAHLERNKNSQRL